MTAEDFYVVKLTRGGSSSVHAYKVSLKVAQAVADAKNQQYQTDEYKVEPWDPQLAGSWTK